MIKLNEKRDHHANRHSATIVIFFKTFLSNSLLLEVHTNLKTQRHDLVLHCSILRAWLLKYNKRNCLSKKHVYIYVHIYVLSWSLKKTVSPCFTSICLLSASCVFTVPYATILNFYTCAILPVQQWQQWCIMASSKQFHTQHV